MAGRITRKHRSMFVTDNSVSNNTSSIENSQEAVFAKLSGHIIDILSVTC